MPGRGSYIIAVDAGTGSLRSGLFHASGQLEHVSVAPYETRFPRPGWAEQAPGDWWACLVKTVRDCMTATGISQDEISAISVDGTSSTVVYLDDAQVPLGDAILWMDNRASPQAQRIFESAHPAIDRSRAGVSSEWLIPKALWLKENLPETYERTKHLMEQCDYLTLRLSGTPTLSLNHLTHRWFYNNRTGGWPLEFYDLIGLGGITEKFSPTILPIGAPIGPLCAAAAEELGLTTDTLVAQGGTDCYLGALGLNAVRPGQVGMIAGSSHVLMPMVSDPVVVTGLFGAHPDCVIEGLCTFEGGLVSSGSVVKWFRDHFVDDAMFEDLAPDEDIYSRLVAEASSIPIGSEGLIVLDYWQGNRTPHTDYDVQGMIWGLTLRHGRAHLFRAILESIAYGTENSLKRLRSAGHQVEAMLVGGGTAKSDLWLQMHADVSNIPVMVPKFTEATLLGSAISAATAAGFYADLVEASDAMVEFDRVIQPDPAAHAEYAKYFELYEASYPQMKPLMHRMAGLLREGT